MSAGRKGGELDVRRESIEQALRYLEQTQPHLLRILVGLSDGAADPNIGREALAEVANLTDVAMVELRGVLDGLEPESEASDV